MRAATGPHLPSPFRAGLEGAEGWGALAFWPFVFVASPSNASGFLSTLVKFFLRHAVHAGSTTLEPTETSESDREWILAVSPFGLRDDALDRIEGGLVRVLVFRLGFPLCFARALWHTRSSIAHEPDARISLQFSN